MNEAIEKRVVILERENAALKVELGALRLLLGNKPAPTPRAESSVKITYPTQRFEVPTAEEFDRLSAIVLGRYPQLAPRADREGFDAQFRVAMQRLLHVGRKDTLDVQHGLEFWTDDCRNWQQQHQVAPGVFVGGAAIAAGVVACGDILYAPLDRFPFDLGFGLVAYGGGRPSTHKWREVLVTRRLLEPTPLDRPSVVRSPATVQQLALNHRKG
jgi:hypothetical protein